jgi:hypothetical protein
VAVAILSFYGGLIALYKISGALFSSKKPAAVAIVAAPAKQVDGNVPAIDSPAFESFVETKAFEALLADGDQLAKLIESA